MSELGLTYNEVLNGIPYRNLLLMQKDKLRPVVGEKLEFVTPQEMGIKFSDE